MDEQELTLRTEIAKLGSKLKELEREEEKWREEYDKRCEPYLNKRHQLVAELFRLIHGYGEGDRLIVTQEICDAKLAAKAWAPYAIERSLGVEVVVTGVFDDSISIETVESPKWMSSIYELHIAKRMREAWLAANSPTAQP